MIDRIGVNDRVIVRIGYQDHPGTVTAIKARNTARVVTDTGDCRDWPIGHLRRANPDEQEQVT